MTLTPEERVEHVTIAPEEVLEGDRSSLATGMVIARAWRDPDFLDRLVARPREVLTAAGIQLPPGLDVRVVTDTPTVRYVNMTRWTSEPAELLPLFREMLPLPEGNEIRLIQNTEQAVYLIVPLAPKEPETLTDADVLRKLAPRAGVWAVNESVVYTEQAAGAFIDVAVAGVEAEAVSTTTNLLAETQLVTLTTAFIGEAEAAATTTTVAAEAEAIATEAEAIATTTTLAAEAEVAAIEAEAAATTTTAAAEAEAVAVEAEGVATTSTLAAEAEAVAVAAIVLT